MTTRFPEREIKQGEPCPWCGTPVGEVLTCAPPKCPDCLGFLAPPSFIGRLSVTDEDLKVARLLNGIWR